MALERGRAGMRAGKTTLRAVMRQAKRKSWMALPGTERKARLRAFNGGSVIGAAAPVLDALGRDWPARIADPGPME